MAERRWTWVGCALIAAGGLCGCTRSMVPQEGTLDAGQEPSKPSKPASQANTTRDAGHDVGSAGDEEPSASDTPSLPRDAGSTTGNPLDPDPDAPPSRCSSSSAPAAIDKVDLLFVVDNSGSMREEQASLRAQFPNMIKRLTSGEASDGSQFPAVKDLHLGVVSSDMGLVGISDIQGCSGLGDDGIMQNQPRIENCQATYPRFLTFNSGLNTPTDVADDFACIASLGTEGCGFEQQLESGLKALWPAADDRVTFLGDVSGFGTMGHGDNENQGFLRNDPVSGLSLVAIVVVTDEEDCSSLNTVHFTPSTYLDPNNPADAQLLQQGLNVRCNANPQNLYPVQRYTNAFKALRAGNEDLVVFAAIVGVPPETVSAEAIGQTDFGDPASREDFYAGILDDEHMQNVIDTHGTPDPADDTMTPSCNTVTGLAYPPRRIVQVAQGFGSNGIVQSICQEDFGPAMNVIAGRIGERLAAPTCPRTR